MLEFFKRPTDRKRKSTGLIVWLGCCMLSIVLDANYWPMVLDGVSSTFYYGKLARSKNRSIECCFSMWFWLNVMVYWNKYVRNVSDRAPSGGAFQHLQEKNTFENNHRHFQIHSACYTNQPKNHHITQESLMKTNCLIVLAVSALEDDKSILNYTAIFETQWPRTTYTFFCFWFRESFMAVLVDNHACTTIRHGGP